MKAITIVIISALLSLGFMRCTHSKVDELKPQLTGSVWTSDVVWNNCTDTLRFSTESEVSFYVCEVGWTYEGAYAIKGDSVEISINSTQIDTDNYDRDRFTSRYLLRINESELDWLRIEHLRAGQFEEVDQEIYDNMKSFRKELNSTENRL